MDALQLSQVSLSNETCQFQLKFQAKLPFLTPDNGIARPVKTKNYNIRTEGAALLIKKAQGKFS